MTSNGDIQSHWSLRLLRSYCPEQLYEEIEGDLIQKFNKDVKAVGEKRAKRRLVYNVIRFCRPGIVLRNEFSVELNRLYMIRNYLITAIRVFQRQKTYSFVNVLGLSVGFASALFIAFYIVDELSYDRFFADADKIYRVGIKERFHGEEFNYTSSPSPLAERMRAELPEVVSAVRIGRAPDYGVRYQDKSFKEKGFIMADSNFFKFFSYELIEGDRETCLKGPDKIMLSQSTAQKYFGNSESVIGKLMALGNGKRTATVSGVFKDIPQNTHFKFNVILSAESWDVIKDECWACYNLYTYFKINDASSLPVVEKKLNDFAKTEIMPRIEKSLNVTHDQFIKSGDAVSFFVQPVTSIHLYSHTDEEYEPNGDIRYVYLFGVIGVFILLIASINFVNLSTARATQRAKEVGIRQTAGAFKTWLIEQFMIESFFYVFLSAFLALILTALLIPIYNDFTGKELSLSFFINPYHLLAIGSMIFMVGVLAGIYPAFVLTSFKPIDVLKGNHRVSGRSTFRNALVVFQFAVSMGLIISTLIIYQQLKFVQQQNLGFDKENVLSIKGVEGLGDNAKVFKEQLLTHPEFVNVSYADQLPPHVSNTLFVKPEHGELAISSYYSSVDYDHLATMKYEMKSGRFFSKDFKSDTSAVVINEAGAKLLGITNYELSKVSFGDQKQKWDVIGVIKDYNFESLRGAIKPLVLFVSEYPGVMAVRMTAGDEAVKIKLAESIWKESTNGSAFQYSFLDEDFDALFRSEQQMGKLFWVFTSMAIFIACLGLFGLITFTASQRVKEIGIRKVMGASVAQIAWLLSGGLMRLVMLSFLIAIPVTWYGMSRWLESFAYRTKFDFSVVLIAGVAGVLIALLTIVYKSIRAALINPVDSLKDF